MSKEYVDYLDTCILQEKRPVTYKLLARKLGIHINTAKQALWEYANGKPQVQAIYCISGRLASDGSEPCLSFKLVKQADLEERKKDFRSISGIHVYSIQPYDVKDLSVLVTASKEIPYLTLEDRVKCGVLKCSAAFMETAHATTMSIDKETKPTSTASLSTLTHTAKADKLAQAPTKKQPAQTSKSLGKRKSLFGSAAEETKPKQVQTPAPPKPEPESSKVEGKKKATLRVEDIFSDEDEEMIEAPAPVEEKKEATPEPIEQEQEEQKEEEQKDQEEEKAAEKEEPVATKPGKVRRKVMKKKHYTNERGFLVTEDVWEWEEVDADQVPESTSKEPPKSPSRPKPQPSPAKKSGKKPSHGGEQKSLLSFWGKRQ
ncbi:hypothetical protein VTP01DRAFT_3992 [Rhizomucor pusillus]|uniref:uncharacterized protein n=1 Tax=Rhizomucor pusillus TaxID=4840 RepID=UPI0037443615